MHSTFNVATAVARTTRTRFARMLLRHAMSFRRILIAIDESPIAAHAADVGVDLARSLGSEVAFIAVVDPALAAAGDSGISSAALLATLRADAQRLLAACRQRAVVEPPPLEFVPVGKPSTEILKAAESWPADVIVLGTHGRGAMTHLLLGSVAEAVVRHASCPVLVVRRHS